MKTITGLLLFLAIIISTSCEGPIGPTGPQGPQGPKGDNGYDAEMGTIVEVYGDFTPQNDYTLYYAFDDYDITVYNGDVVLVYILWEQVEANDGGLIDVWRLLPQTVVTDDGVVQYNFDFTTADVQIYLEGTVSEYLPAETDDQVFRIAVLPAILAEDKSIDISNFDAVLKSININSNSIEKIDASSDIHL